MAVLPAAAALAIGFLLGRQTTNQHEDPSTSSDAVDTPHGTPSEGLQASDAHQQDHSSACEEQLADCEQRLGFASEVINRQTEEKVGTPVPFPDDLPPQYTAEGFETAVREALVECRAEELDLSHVDCAEFPCMAFFSQPENSHNRSMDELRSCDGWRRRFESGGQANSSFMTDEGVAEYSMASVEPRGVKRDDNSSTRWKTRLREGEATLMEAWGGREYTELERVESSLEFWREVRDRRIGESDGEDDVSGVDDILAELEEERASLLASEGE